MSDELSKVLDHIEQDPELDLEDVSRRPTCVEVTGVLRADEPRPSLPREEALAAAPATADGGFRVPSRADERRARAHRGPGRRARSGPASSPRRALDAYRERAAGDELNAFLWVAEEAPRRPRRTRPSPAFRSASRTCSAPRASPARPARASSRATGPRTPRRSVEHPGRGRARCSARRTRTSSPWARPTSTPATARSRTRGTARGSRAARAAAARPRSPPASSPGRSEPTPAARSASPPPCAGSSG